MSEDKNSITLTDQELDQVQGGAASKLTDREASVEKLSEAPDKIAASLMSPMAEIAKDPTMAEIAKDPTRKS